jgi:F420-dependent oxidoreductase-like protein
MRIGLTIANFTWPEAPASIGPRLAEIARTADDAGFASLWVMDHFFQIEMLGAPDEPMLEGYTTMGYIAGLTKRAQLGLLVTGVHYRYPGILAKTITTLDVLSGGRAYLGIGAGWNEQESRGLGVPFPSTRARFEQLEETLQIVRQMWADDRTPYQGQHFQLADPLNHPLPLSQPHPPILVGGGGEKKTLRLVAQYADACNLFADPTLEGLRHKLAILRQHCEDVGRPYDEIERTAMDIAPVSDAQSAQRVIARCRDLAEAGIQHVIMGVPNIHEITPLEIIGREIIPAVAEL